MAVLTESFGQLSEQDRAQLLHLLEKLTARQLGDGHA